MMINNLTKKGDHKTNTIMVNNLTNKVDPKIYGE